MAGDLQQEEQKESCSRPETEALSCQRVFKKSSPNNKLTLYLSSRDIVVSAGRIDRLQGVIWVDPEFIDQRKVYGQVTLTFRYGREDEEVMGLKFCNEAVMCLAQLYPPHPAAQAPGGNTPLQEALLKRLGPNAYPFSMEITPMAPPSVQLVPAKQYNGAPIGTSYDIRAYIDCADEKFHRRTTVRMGIRVVQRAIAPPAPFSYNASGNYLNVKQRYMGGDKIHLFGSRSNPIEKYESKSNSMSPAHHQKNSRQEKKGSIVRVKSNEEIRTLNSNSERRKRDFVKSRSRSEASSKHRENGLMDGESKDSVSGEKESEVDQAEEENEEEKRGEKQAEGDGEAEKVKEEVEQYQNDDGVKGELRNGAALGESSSGSDEDVSESRQKDDELKRRRPSTVPTICSGKRPSLAAFLSEIPPPHALIQKPFLLSNGRIELEASLDKAVYAHGEEILVNVKVQNISSKTVKRIKVFVVQHVDVCMFSNGKFKNVVASADCKKDYPIQPGNQLHKTYSLLPNKSITKNWIALEDSYSKTSSTLSSTVTSPSSNPEDRNVFAIYVTYYVKVKLLFSVMGGELSLKLPFTLMHTCPESDPHSMLTKDLESPRGDPAKGSPAEEVKPEKDGT